MTLDELNKTKAALEAQLKILSASPEAAREYLYARLGTHNRDGTLCAQYGGDYTDDDHPVHSEEAV